MQPLGAECDPQPHSQQVKKRGSGPTTFRNWILPTICELGRESWASNEITTLVHAWRDPEQRIQLTHAQMPDPWKWEVIKLYCFQLLNLWSFVISGFSLIYSCLLTLANTTLSLLLSWIKYSKISNFVVFQGALYLLGPVYFQDEPVPFYRKTLLGLWTVLNPLTNLCRTDIVSGEAPFPRPQHSSPLTRCLASLLPFCSFQYRGLAHFFGYSYSYLMLLMLLWMKLFKYSCSDYLLLVYTNKQSFV